MLIMIPYPTFNVKRDENICLPARIATAVEMCYTKDGSLHAIFLLEELHTYHAH